MCMCFPWASYWKNLLIQCRPGGKAWPGTDWSVGNFSH